MIDIYDALHAAFSATGQDCDEHPVEGWISTAGMGTNGEWLLVGQADPDRNAVIIYSLLPDPVAPERRDDVTRAVTEINYGLALGCFELGLQDGDLRFRASAPFIGPPDELIRALVAVALGTTDAFLPQLAAAATAP